MANVWPARVSWETGCVWNLRPCDGVTSYQPWENESLVMTAIVLCWLSM